MAILTKSEEEKRRAIQKSDSVEKLDFDATVNRSVQMVYKFEDECFIWGPASVEIVDKEKDKIRVDALEKALPQLLKRARLSYAHTDQIVGRILERFETKDEVEVVVDGQTYKRKEFPTAVLDLDDGQPPAMFVAGEVYNDTEQSRNVRQKIEKGDIDSYSISGEALVTQKRVDGNLVYDDILELDLSAVTLCEEGMNQGAKFARVNSEIDDTQVAEVTAKSYSVENASLSDPDAVAELAKSENMTEEETESTEKEETQDFDDFVKQDEIPESIASETFVQEKLDETVDKTVDAVADQVNKQLPKGDLATVGYIDKAVDAAVEEALEEKEDHKDEEEEYEEDKEKEELPEPPEPPEEEEEEEEEVEVEASERDKALDDEAQTALKEALPDDVWKVVSEYVGDSKMDKSEESSEEPNVSDELEKQVASILEGQGAGSPGIPTGDDEDEFEKNYEVDEDEGADESPALSNFY